MNDKMPSSEIIDSMVQMKMEEAADVFSISELEAIIENPQAALESLIACCKAKLAQYDES